MQSGAAITAAAVSNLIFKFIYDEHGRIIEKTVPGVGPVYVVYDPLNRPVLLQNAKLRASGQWNYIKYDVKGRAIAQGLYTNTTYTTRAAMQTYVSGLNYSVLWYESRTSTAATGYYTNNVFPTTGRTDLAFSYYDDYDLNQDGAADYTYVSQGLSGESQATSAVRGMPTMTRIASVGTGVSSIWFIKVVFYDKRGITIQTISNNQLNTAVSDVATVVADFTGKPYLRRWLR